MKLVTFLTSANEQHIGAIGNDETLIVDFTGTDPARIFATCSVSSMAVRTRSTRRARSGKAPKRLSCRRRAGGSLLLCRSRARCAIARASKST